MKKEFLIFFILCKDRQMPTVSAREKNQEVLDKQDKICEAVLAINNTLKGINTSIREICDVIKHKK